MKRNCCCCHCYFCYCCRCCWRRRLSWGWICAWGMLLRSIEELFVVDGNWRTREMRSFFIVCGTQNANQQKAYDSTTHAFSVWRGFDKVIQLYSGYYYSGNRNRRNEMANARLRWMAVESPFRQCVCLWFKDSKWMSRISISAQLNCRALLFQSFWQFLWLFDRKSQRRKKYAHTITK